MANKAAEAREVARGKGKEKILFGVLLLFLPSVVRVLNLEPFNLNIGILGLIMISLAPVGLVLLAIGLVTLAKNPKR